LQDEITGLADSVAVLRTGIKRIEGRQTARMGRENSTEIPDTTSGLSKAVLRAKFGLRPGVPAPHTG
jgi:hypothetical protein